MCLIAYKILIYCLQIYQLTNTSMCASSWCTHLILVHTAYGLPTPPVPLKSSFGSSFPTRSVSSPTAIQRLRNLSPYTYASSGTLVILLFTTIITHIVVVQRCHISLLRRCHSPLLCTGQTRIRIKLDPRFVHKEYN